MPPEDAKRDPRVYLTAKRPILAAAVGLALAFNLGTTKADTRGPGAKSSEASTMKTGEGIISLPSSHSVPATLDRVEAALRAKGIKIFARIDHSGEAEKVGLKMRPTQLLIFGSPKAGTPVMVAAPTAAIDLPLKALAWQDGDGKVWLSYNDPQYLRRRFGLTEDVVKGLTGAGSLLEEALK
jgi:uncharacterized protein (DUF302 family)